MYICVCNATTERHIAVAVEDGTSCMKQLRRKLGVATQCGRCARCAREYLDQVLAAREEAPDGCCPAR